MPVVELTTLWCSKCREWTAHTIDVLPCCRKCVDRESHRALRLQEAMAQSQVPSKPKRIYRVARRLDPIGRR